MAEGGHIALGVLVGLVSTSVQSVGLTLQRKSHILEDEKEFQDTRRPAYKRRRWQVGMLMFVISNIVGSTIQITTLPLPVLSTLQASGLVFNSICAALILGEPFTRYSFAGTVLVAGGALLIAMFGAIDDPAHNLDQLLALLREQQFILWMIGTALVVVAIVVGSRFLKAVAARNGRGNTPRIRLLRGMAYGGVSGILSAHSLLVAKSAVELLVRTIVDGDNQFNRFPSWLILIGLVALALSQLYCLHRGLKLCSTSVLYPFVFCVYNIIAILDGLIYFRQTSQLSLLSALLIALGTVILLAGVVCLSWRLHQDSASKPPLNQNPLTPGLGFVPSDTDSESGSLLSPTYEDEESTLIEPVQRSATAPVKTPISPSLQASTYGTLRPKRNVRLSSPSQSSTRTSPNSLKISRRRRSKTTIPEADEIWGELEEESPSPISSPFSARRRSFQARTPTPSRLRPSIGSESAMESSMELPPPTPNERSGLLARSSTGRTYRDRRRRRASVAGGEFGAGEERSQDAVGGWWKMKKWWKVGRDKDKRGKKRDGGESGDIGGEGAV